MTVHVHATYCNCILFMSMETPKMVFLLLNGTQYARPKMAVRSTQGQNRAVRSTQGGGGVNPKMSLVGKCKKVKVKEKHL